MYNSHLLKKEIAVSEYEAVYKEKQRGHFENYVQVLPEYPIGLCPFCCVENIEKIDTYSPDNWGRIEPDVSLHTEDGIVNHCKHFVIVEPFLYVPAHDKRAVKSTLWNDVFPFVNLPVPEHIDGALWSTQVQSPPLFIERQPTVVGFALEQRLAQAVIHTLPVCEPVNNEFQPKYTLFIISYYSEKPDEAYSAIKREAIRRSEAISATLLVLPEPHEIHWFDLAQWVERGLLYWVDADKNGELTLRTQDIESFPYKNLERLVTK
ncbi:MAG: hypothetical protein ACOYYF_07870 [Chloroflexota bacterium]|nr:hypothetical protein [Chloroflexota bacterium]MBI5701906.1 hypothetical protein [Chloroflexota bacterium]